MESEIISDVRPISLRDNNCIILKKKEYDDLVKAADKGIMLHIGVSNSENYDIDIKAHQGCIILNTDGIGLSPSISKQIYRISKYLKDEFDSIISGNDRVIKKFHTEDLESLQFDLLDEFSKLSWWNRLFFNPEKIKKNIYDYNYINSDVFQGK